MSVRRETPNSGGPSFRVMPNQFFIQKSLSLVSEQTSAEDFKEQKNKQFAVLKKPLKSGRVSQLRFHGVLCRLVYASCVVALGVVTGGRQRAVKNRRDCGTRWSRWAYLGPVRAACGQSVVGGWRGNSSYPANVA